MAAASPLKAIEQVISPYLQSHPNTTFYNLSLNPYRDRFENSSKVDLLPRGSLLMWIDNTLGSINSFQDRTAGQWTNIIHAAEQVFPKKIQDQVHLTKFGINDGSPQNHGDFGDYPFWREGFWVGDSQARQ